MGNSWSRMVSTYSPELAREAERQMEAGLLPRNFQYAVPREWAEADPYRLRRTIWLYEGREILTGRPCELSVTDE